MPGFRYGRGMRLMFIVFVIASLAAPEVALAQVTSPAPPGRQAGNDVRPELPASVYRKRRERLMKRLGPCAAAIRATSGHGYEPDGVDHDFFYLTGLTEPGSLLLLSPRQIDKQILLLPALDAEAEKWTGYKEPSSPRLRSELGVDVLIRSQRRQNWHLARAIRQSRCYTHLRPAFFDAQAFDPAMLGKYLTAFNARAEQGWEVLEDMRAVKEPEEIALMEKAIAITIEGHRAAAGSLGAGMTEKVLASRIENAFYAAGATGLAFPSIVASGPNGAVLHWEKQDRSIAEGDLVVIDIGASYGGYAADLTRTFPVSGTFTPEQRKIYDLVLRVQADVIAAVRPGVSLARLNQLAQQAIEQAGYELSHTIGHFVGLEVHDVGDPDAPLEPGMIITVEPGIYIRDTLGVRLEDMVLVTSQGHRLLSADLPRKAEDIEAWARAARAR